MVERSTSEAQKNIRLVQQTLAKDLGKLNEVVPGISNES